ncbi:YbhB/YbcL family Raf kinase inhibitor-like protein [Streptoalloteichus hindustanus]|uniref:Phospholipid-binding protein, PBP family n=1 Tax=Streptoalloteichus hindustanus TaxID=2017 RepID=A0A1M4Y9Z5_STRHI|nr:YbhB/YbcL family Raf kinase inhibitor-like protein [Streptoalloteichus hindustanus]SHF02637.1 hypothetical protein SAMN05444320_102292 [Streptoalloteichus hindustanus]
MPDPGSHKYDIQRARLRARYDDQGVPDQNADRAANEELQREHPPRRVGSPERAAGPLGTRGTSRGDPSLEDVAKAPEGGGIGLHSAAFNDHTMIPNHYALDGDNASPPLQWDHVPDGAEELALVVEDPDAPGRTFVHWVVTGIDPSVTEVGEGAVPEGASAGRNDFGDVGWDGPRPPVGETHRYFFHLYAADQPLGLGEGCTADDVRTALAGHEVASGTLVGLFGR